jgi:hypothetical protein
MFSEKIFPPISRIFDFWNNDCDAYIDVKK